MINVLCAAALCAVSLYGLRQLFADGVSVVFRGFDGRGVLAGFIVSTAAALLLGPLNGMAVVLALLLHESGRWMALNALGSPERAFRLLPALTGHAPAPLCGDEARAFHALMGPVVALPPMVLCLALSLALDGAAAGFLRALAISVCALGCIWLLPVRGLDGGVLSAAVLPALPRPAVLVLLVPALGIPALNGWQGAPALLAGLMLALVALLPRRRAQGGRPMRPEAARLALGGWAVTLLTCLTGWVLLTAP